MNKIVVVTASIPELDRRAEALAHRLGLVHAQGKEALLCDYQLLVTPDFLGLANPHDKTSTPFYIDFTSGAWDYRLRQAGRRSEMLGRAINLHPKDHPSVVDATAGLGRDGFLLASLGYTVTMIERSPLLHALLADGLERAAAHPELAETLARLTLVEADALHWLAVQPIQPDVIYLDPMFPPRKKSAAVKKEMVILHDLLGSADDADALLEVAFACAKKRVVVKRPRLAETVSARRPTYSLPGTSSRFDIYVK